MARARGLAPWQPRAKSLALLGQVNAVLDEYREHLPLTIRQIFYRLVGVHAYDKTEAAYDRLGEMLNRARRAGFVRFDAIRDDGVDMRAPTAWDDADHLVTAIRNSITNFRLDRQAKHGLAGFLGGSPAAEVLHIGDHDPSGVHVFSSLAGRRPAVDDRMDQAAWRQVRAAEERAKTSLLGRFAGI